MDIIDIAGLVTVITAGATTLYLLYRNYTGKYAEGYIDGYLDCLEGKQMHGDEPHP